MSHIFSFSKHFFFLARPCSSLWVQCLRIQPRLLPTRPLQIPAARSPATCGPWEDGWSPDLNGLLTLQPSFSTACWPPPLFETPAPAQVADTDVSAQPLPKLARPRWASARLYVLWALSRCICKCTSPLHITPWGRGWYGINDHLQLLNLLFSKGPQEAVLWGCHVSFYFWWLPLIRHLDRNQVKFVRSLPRLYFKHGVQVLKVWVDSVILHHFQHNFWKYQWATL